MGAAEAELQNRIALGRLANPGRLRRDEGLEVDDIEERGFEELALNDGAADADERLVRKDNGAFGHRIHIAGKFQVAQIVEEGLLEKGLAIVPSQRLEIGDFVAIDLKIAKVVNGICQAAGNAVAALKWILTEKEMKDGLALLNAILPIAVGHRELIEVGQKNRVFLMRFTHSVVNTL